MKTPRSRREFLADVGRGMLIATVGSSTAADLGLATARAADGPERLEFGALEPLVSRLQETPIESLLPTLVGAIQSGTELRQLVAAAALANARTFGGEDYVGFHTMMALAPALHMSGELSGQRQALPVLKVLYRNTNRIREFGGSAKEVLHTVAPGTLEPGRVPGEQVREAVRAKDMEGAERVFAAAATTPGEALNAVLFAVQDNTEVHRTVLPYRAWDLLGLVGMENAHTLLRQSVRYCVKSEREWRHTAEHDRPRELLPQLLERFGLGRRSLGTRPAEDGWVEALSKTIFEGTPDHAAEAVAAALAEGFEPDAIGEAISLATNQLVLRDAGREPGQAQPGKPAGSVHGDSIGVHASDSANAWRNMARAANPRNAAACLILGAFQAAYDRVNRGGKFHEWQPRPTEEELRAVAAVDPKSLIGALEEAIRGNDQARACALTHRAGDAGVAPREVFNVLLRYAISEDGALHAEKYYRTVSEDFASSRPAFRWRHLVALARVTASEYGRPAPGYAEACELLRV